MIALIVCGVLAATGLGIRKYLDLKATRNSLRDDKTELRSKLTDARRKVDVLRRKLQREQDLVAAQRAQLRELDSLAFLGASDHTTGPEFELRVERISPRPDPKTARYPDCVFTAKAKIIFAPASAAANEKLTAGSEILIGLLAFRNRLPHVMPVKAGDILSCELLPPERVSKRVASIQRVNTLEEYRLPLYFAVRVRTAVVERAKFETAKRNEARPVIGREEAIRRDLSSIEETLNAHGGDWERWFGELAPRRESLAAQLEANDRELNLAERFSFTGLQSVTATPSDEWPDPQIAALKTLDRQLRKRGIDLIILPVPDREYATAHMFLSGFSAGEAINPYHDYLLQRLLKEDLEVVDIRRRLVEAWNRFEHVFFDGKDKHPAEGAVDVMADALAGRLRRYAFKPQHEVVEVAKVMHGIPSGYPWFPARARESECYSATRVFDTRGAALPPEGDEASPVLLIGDSFTGVPAAYGVRNASLAEHITKETGILPRKLEIAGGGWKVPAHLARNAHLLDGTKVVLFVFDGAYLRTHKPDDPTRQWIPVDLPPDTSSRTNAPPSM